jgi:hypothetical protein
MSGEVTVRRRARALGATAAALALGLSCARGDPGGAPSAAPVVVSIEDVDAAALPAAPTAPSVARERPEPRPNPPLRPAESTPLPDPPPGMPVQRHADGTCWVWPRASPKDPGPLVAVRCPR